ncbi:hypothetical protein NQ176_g8380 [Zarea fungicola]|uniref:Uncharacterized protein n=1 Tax=Zarea fungicola TaxID=93591 RepID=A0ACC1MTP0_9HYPO|nr:hypothetical protein NQ176_g8380 [Lecanicillium fungicola]
MTKDYKDKGKEKVKLRAAMMSKLKQKERNFRIDLLYNVGESSFVILQRCFQGHEINQDISDTKRLNYYITITSFLPSQTDFAPVMMQTIQQPPGTENPSPCEECKGPSNLMSAEMEKSSPCEEYKDPSDPISSSVPEKQQEPLEANSYRVKRESDDKLSSSPPHSPSAFPSYFGALRSSRPETDSEADSEVSRCCDFCSKSQTSDDDAEMTAYFLTADFLDCMFELGSFMKECKGGIALESQYLCSQLLSKHQTVPEDSLFELERLQKFEELLAQRNDEMVFRDMTALIIPSLTNRIIRDAHHLDLLAEAIKEPWESCVTYNRELPQPKPSYSLGFDASAFTSEQLSKLRQHPLYQNTLRQGFYTTPSSTMILPFFTCEVKSCNSNMELADRQNILSATIGLQGLVKLFRAVNREQELHRQTLFFSISHNDKTVYIYGYCPIIDGESTRYYRHTIFQYLVFASQGEQRWSAYKFVKNLHDIFAPKLHSLICSAIDGLAHQQ